MAAAGHDVRKRRPAHEGGVEAGAAQRHAHAVAKAHHGIGGVQRVHDVLTAVQFIRSHERPSISINLIALDSTGPVAAAARAQALGAFSKAAIHLGEFRFGRILDLRSPDFVPGGAKYEDVEGLIALGDGALRRVQPGGDVAETISWITQ